MNVVTLACVLASPAAAVALPLVNKIPLSIPTRLVFILVNFPLAPVAQYKVGLLIVTPVPTKVDARAAAVWLLVTINCALALLQSIRLMMPQKRIIRLYMSKCFMIEVNKW